MSEVGAPRSGRLHALFPRVCRFVGLPFLGVFVLLGVLVLLAALALTGCGGGPDLPDDGVVVFDFARDLDVAETHWERGRLRVAEPAFERRMGEGWGPLEDGAGGAFRWTLGTRAEFDVFVARPRDVDFVCRCDAFQWPEAPAQLLTVEVGSFRSEPVVVDGEDRPVRIPADAWKPGWNRLILGASRAAAPAEVTESDDARPLALRVEALEFRGLLDAEPPTAEGGVLRLPAGSAVISYGEGAGQVWTPGEVEETGSVRLGVYLRTEEVSGVARRALRPGPVEAARGAALAVELVAEPTEPGLWRRLFGGGADGGELRLEGAGVLLSAEQMARLQAPTEEAPEEAAEEAARSRGTAAGVLLYMVDTLRADRVGAYDARAAERGLTPRLDALAEESVVFTEARAQSSWTRPSVVSTFTGLYPQSHGVDDRNDALGGSVETVAEILHAAGIPAGAIFTNGNISHRFGLGQGFSEYRHLAEDRSRESVHVLADELNAWGLHWLDTHRETEGDQPFFLYLHATDPHAPYTPPSPWAERFAPGADRTLATLDAFRALRGGAGDEPVRDDLLALYDAEVAWTDHQMGELFDALRERGLWDDLLVIVVSDHGEEFLDHGSWEHGKTLYDEQLLVPLLVKPPAGAGTPRRVAGPAGHVDLAPTLLDALGVDYDPSRFDGRSLWPAVTGAAEGATGAPTLGHLELSDVSLRSLVAGRWKLIEDLRRKDPRLFDVEADPAEQQDLEDAETLRSKVLGQERRRLERSLSAGSESATEIELDEETRKQLEALGYAG